MRRETQKNLNRFSQKNSFRFKNKTSLFIHSQNKSERRYKMRKANLRKEIKFILPVIILSALLSSFIMNGCGDSNIAGVQNKSTGIRSAGENIPEKRYDSTTIKLDMDISFKSELISDSKILESNNGYHFGNITKIDRDLKTNEILDLQALQSSGIFGLYIGSTGSFTLSNADGMSFTSKSVLLEKCEFIDLKLKNTSGKPAHIKGFVAGE